MNPQAVETDPRRRLAQLLPELRAFARFVASSPSQADDLVQEAIVRVLRGLDARADAGEPPPDDLRTWCLAIVRNVRHEQRRVQRREVTGISDTLPETPVPPTQEARGQVRDLARALAALPPLLREALVLVGAQGLAYEEAALVVGVPVGTMKARVSRARRLLGDHLGHVNG